MTFDQYLTTSHSSRLDTLRGFVTNLWAAGDPLHPLYTLHGPQHLRQVEKIIEHILAPEHRDKTKMAHIVDREQLFWLLASAWLHDVGMIVSPSAQDEAAALAAGVSVADWVRDRHHMRSRDYIVACARDLGFNDFEAQVIGTICFGHRREDLTTNSAFSTSYPDTQFLAAVLRIADELDVTVARTPTELLNLKWETLDDASKWHWLKHWCVPCAHARHHESKDEGPPTLILSYQLVVRLPDDSLKAAFLDRVLRPIRRTMQDEKVGMILWRKHLGIEVDRFQHTVQYVEKGPDGVGLDDRLRAVLKPAMEPLGGGQAFRQRLSDALPEPAVVMLLRQCDRVLNAGPRFLPVVSLANESIERYLSALLGAPDCSALETAKQSFAESYQAWSLKACDEGTPSAQVLREMGIQWAKLADLAWRLVAMTRGREAEQLSQLTHLLMCLETEASELAAWVIGKEGQSPSARLQAITTLGVLAEKGMASCYQAALKASCDADSAVRTEAARALGYLPGPKTLDRLEEMLRGDVEGEVRMAARIAMRRVLDQREDADVRLKGRKVLIVDDEGFLTISLVDALRKRDIEVKVCTDHGQAEGILQVWGPDAVVCELMRPGGADHGACPAAGDMPGLTLGRFIRERLQLRTPFVATSLVNPDNIARHLASIGAAYVQKPTTVDKFVHTIESLLADGDLPCSPPLPTPAPEAKQHEASSTDT